MASAHPKTVHVFVSEFATQECLPQGKDQATGKMTGLTSIMPTRFDRVEKTFSSKIMFSSIRFAGMGKVIQFLAAKSLVSD